MKAKELVFFPGKRIETQPFQQLKNWICFWLVVLKNSEDVNFTVSEDGRISVMFTRCDIFFPSSKPAKPEGYTCQNTFQFGGTSFTKLSKLSTNKTTLPETNITPKDGGFQ